MTDDIDKKILSILQKDANIPLTELSKKVEFAEKEKTNLDLCRRTLDQLVNKKLVEKDKVSGKKAIENQYRLRLRQ